LILHDLKIINLIIIFPIIEKQEIRAINKVIPINHHLKEIANEMTKLELQLALSIFQITNEYIIYDSNNREWRNYTRKTLKLSANIIPHHSIHVTSRI